MPESSKTGPMRLLLLNFASKLILPSMSNGMSSCVLVLSITQDALYELWQGAHSLLTIRSLHWHIVDSDGKLCSGLLSGDGL